MSTEKKPTPRVRNTSTSNGKSVRIDLPVPDMGEVQEFRVERYGLTVLVQRDRFESQETKRGRYTVTSPISPDRRTHAARLGTGEAKAKRMNTTLCEEKKPETAKARSGQRIDIALEAVTCVACRKVLVDEGIELQGGVS